MPTTRKKVLLVEEDGAELSRKTETRMEADNIFINDDVVQLGVDNIEDAVLALRQLKSLKIAHLLKKPGQGFQVVSYDNLHVMADDSINNIIGLRFGECNE